MQQNRTKDVLGERLMWCKITMDLGYAVLTLCVGNEFCVQNNSESWILECMFLQRNLEDQDSIVVYFSVPWCACVSLASESIFVHFLSVVVLHHNCSLK